MKRFLSLIVVLAMVIGMVPFGVFAADDSGVEITDIETALTVELNEGNDWWCDYYWVPTEDGTLTIISSSSTESSEVEYLEEQYAMGENITIEVTKDEPVAFSVYDESDAKVTLTFLFTAAEGTEGNPHTLLNIVDTEITLDAGVTTYYRGRFSEVTMYVEPAVGVTVKYNNETYSAEDGVLSISFPKTTAVPIPQVDIGITAQTAGTYTLRFVKPEGTYENPVELKMETGEDGNASYKGSATVAAATDGYYYNWTAPAAGELTITMPNTGDWFYKLYNKTSTETEQDDTTVEKDPDSGKEVAINYSATVSVKKDEVVEILVNTFNPNDKYSAPAGTVDFELSFVKGTEEEENGSGGSGDVTGTTVTLNPNVFHEETYTAPSDGTVTVKINAVDTGFRFWFGENLPTSGTAPASYDFTVYANQEYLFRIQGYKGWSEVEATITYELVFTEGSIEEEKDAHDFGPALAVGDNTLTLLETAVVTLYEFAPEEMGVYTFTAPTDVLIGNWNTSFNPMDMTENKTNTLEWTCSSIGQSVLIGVSDVEDSFTLNVAKTSDYIVEEIPLYTYENKATLSEYTLPENAILGDYVDVYGDTHTAVLGDDGYYHLDSEDGAILLMDLNYNDIVLTNALNSDRPVMYAYVTDEDGKQARYDIGAAMQAYEAVMDNNGYYPVTEDLIFFYDVYATGAGTYTFYLEDGYNEECVWMYCCRTMTIEEEPAPGSEQNPIYPEFVWNEDQTEADATVVAPVGTTYYAVYGDGMELTINDGEPTLLVANGMGRVPAIFSITNDGEAEAEYALHIACPAGHQMNPETLVVGWNDVAVAEGDNDGYYYTYVAESTGTLSAYIYSITDGVDGDIVVFNTTSYEYLSLSKDGVADEYGDMVLNMEVTEGDVVQIQVMALPDASYTYPAAEITWVSNFAYPLGSEQNPIYPEFVWNEDQTEADATVVAPVGTTYYAVYGGGMELTINDGEPTLLVANGMGRVPAIFSITNDGEAEAEYALHIAYPAGHQMNPDILVIGENTATIEAGNTQGYYYTWTAEADGTLSITMPEGDWTYVINNMTTNKHGDNQWSDSNPVVNPGTVEVEAGDEIQIMVNTYDPASPYNAPAGTLVITAAFEAAVEKFDFFAANVIMGNNLDMKFAFEKNAVEDWTGHYVVIEREYADGKANDVQTVPYEQWTTNGNYYVVEYKGLAAKEMSDTITLVVYNAEGQAVSNPWVDSMRDYATRQISNVTNALQKTMFVDMLNYGAAAQEFFGYGTDDLANSKLTEAQKALASEGKAFTAKLDQGDKWVASNLILESNINFMIAFNGLSTEMSAKVEFTNHYGNPVFVDVAGSEFGKNGNYYYVAIDELVIADARQEITVTIYNADGSVYTTCQESIEDYLARRSNVSTLFEAIMKFADSAYAYLHRND